MKNYIIYFAIVAALSLSSCASAVAVPGTDTSGSSEQALKNQAINADNESPEKWSARAQEVLMSALSLSGIRYQYGGNNPDSGFDCSGFVRHVFKESSNIILPRSALEMSQIGKTIAKNKLQPGDLVFFNTLKSAFSHVGIYIGNHRFIHSPRKGSEVRIESLDAHYWATRYDGAQRINSNE